MYYTNTSDNSYIAASASVCSTTPAMSLPPSLPHFFCDRLCDPLDYLLVPYLFLSYHPSYPLYLFHLHPFQQSLSSKSPRLSPRHHLPIL
jgi:hypothetical protein